MSLTLTQIETSKEILIDLYWKREKTLIEVSKILSCSLRKVNYFMRKYKIKRRIAGPIKKEKKKLFCKTKDCNREITKRSESGYCKSCAGIKAWENNKERKNKASIRWKNKNNPNFNGLSKEHKLKITNANKGKSLNHKKNCKCSFCKAKRGELNGINSYSYIDGRRCEQQYCIEPNCNNPVTKRGNRCSSCAHEGERNGCYGKDMSKENNPVWIKDRSLMEYGDEFNNTLKEKIRERDNYICQVCEKTQLENGKQLDVHHIDYNKKNCKEENLIALCVKCHRETNGNREYWKKYFEEKINNVFEFV